ncbi:MAG TPA: dihydrodipicolinate synthase family protein [Solirubrobacteraceae bacterium]|nr:dihydrodipicolinate synthase family protein [Solirubrobacteraceae bacterium]
MESKPWHGVLVANPLTLDDNLEVDFDRYAAHIAWLAESGCDGITPNGSLGEYQTLTADERARLVTTAMQAAPDGFSVIPAVGAYGSRESVRWADQAAEAGAAAVMALPPNSYRAGERSVLEHYRALAAVGLPVVAYNNPFDTKVDLGPELLAKLHGEGLIVAIKEFAGDPRRAYAVRELAPELDVLIGSDDTVLEIALAGGKGWISGYTSVFPRSCVSLYRASVRADVDTAIPVYRALHALLRWDSKTEFVQAIKLSMDIVGRNGGRCRPPRVALAPEQEAEVRRLTEQAVAAGMN